MAQSKTVTATPPNGTATVTVDPDTCLMAGTTVTITATGLLPYAKPANQLGTVLECKNDPGQPTVQLGGPTSRSASRSAGHRLPPDGGGDAQPDFHRGPRDNRPPHLRDGVGRESDAAAAGYPCPPTPAQTADPCVIAVVTKGATRSWCPSPSTPAVWGRISRLTGVSRREIVDHPAPHEGGGGHHQAVIGLLAFTGPGPGLWWIGLTGVLLMAPVDGWLVVDEPRRLRRRVVPAAPLIACWSLGGDSNP